MAHSRDEESPDPSPSEDGSQALSTVSSSEDASQALSTVSSPEDAKADLLARLNKITSRIAQSTGLKDSTYDSLHTILDVAERDCPDLAHYDEDKDFARAVSKSEEASAALKTTSESLVNHQNISNANVGEFEEQISHVVEQFRSRYEELRHVHDITILKTERAAQRIIELERNVKQLGTELAADESEMTFLKLQLKALEIQALRYIPADDDEGLTEGFRRWKLDWADVSQRFQTRRRRQVKLE